MHTVYIHIDETLESQQLSAISSELQSMPHINDVEINERLPHDLLVEYQPHSGLPMSILDCLQRRGLHADIMSC